MFLPRESISLDSCSVLALHGAMELSSMRVEYSQRELRRRDLRPDPVEQFGLWLGEACASGIAEPNAMSLATVSAEGQPVVRMVLLKQYDSKGFVFFTNIESRKAHQIQHNPKVALHFPWVALHRQVAIHGIAERLTAGEVLGYFLKRPFGSQLAAWVSPQSQVISSRALLEEKWEEAKRRFSEGRVPLPSFWGGFRVRPQEMEFWQGRPNRLHDRFLYRATAGGWQIERLAP